MNIFLNFLILISTSFKILLEHANNLTGKSTTTSDGLLSYNQPSSKEYYLERVNSFQPSTHRPLKSLAKKNKFLSID